MAEKKECNPTEHYFAQLGTFASQTPQLFCTKCGKIVSVPPAK